MLFLFFFGRAMSSIVLYIRDSGFITGILRAAFEDDFAFSFVVQLLICSVSS